MTMCVYNQVVLPRSISMCAHTQCHLTVVLRSCTTDFRQVAPLLSITVAWVCLEAVSAKVAINESRHLLQTVDSQPLVNAFIEKQLPYRPSRNTLCVNVLCAIPTYFMVANDTWPAPESLLYNDPSTMATKP